tara:strand:+ start:7218 stop:8360 length:1143 start_codon:yes stop_codon:yes gene_type:complete
MQPIPPNRLRKIRIWSHSNKLAELTECETTKQSHSLLDFASNDYLGLSTHPNLINAAKEVMSSEGVGAGASRLVTGSRPIHKELEGSLGSWLQRDQVLLFPSGFQANIAAVIALADRNTWVFADKFIHHSLLLGVKASGARLSRYAHNDLSDLKKKLSLCLKKEPNRKTLVITESLFSMEGTSPELEKLAKLCEHFGTQLLVDEAHALGIMGTDGKGLSYGLSSPITIISGTFGKAFGSGGAFLASNKKIGEHLIQTSGAFRYTTALAPPLSASALAALKLIQANPHWGKELQKQAMLWRRKLKEKNWSLPHSNSPIIPLIIGSDEKAIQQQEKLEEKGILTVAIRPPTVPEGKSRLRLVIRRNLPENALSKFLLALSDS